MANARVWDQLFRIVVVVGLGIGLWQQQRIARQLDSFAATGSPRAGSATSPAQPPKPSSPVTTVNLDLAVAGAPSRGVDATQVVILEFSDFQCPFCGRYVRDTYPRVVADYVDTGKVRYVFKHLPIESLHSNAMNAALAASCAAIQGKFWQLHDRLFANQTALGLPALLTYASGLGIDEAAYRSCLNDRQPTAAVQADRDDGMKAELSGTPAFFIGRMGADGRLHAVRRIVGAQPYSMFQSALDEVLSGRAGSQ